MLFRVFLLFLFVVLNDTLSQNLALEKWHSYTSLVNVTSSDYDNENRIWSATSGGVFALSLTNHEYLSFNNTNGLYSSETKTVKFNPFTNEIYIGTTNGVLSIYQNSKWTNLLDIKNASLTNPEISNFYFTDSIVYILGGFGITTFDPIKKIFLKTPSRLGIIQPGTPANDCLIFHDTLWVATNIGIAKISTKLNISNPSNWQNILNFNENHNPRISFLASINDTLYAFSDTIIYKWENDKFISVLELPSYDFINSVEVFGKRILYSTPYAIRDLNGEMLFYYLSSPNLEKFNGFTISNNGLLSIYLENNGILFYDPKSQTKKHFLPNSPASNLFTFLVVDDSGAVWSATETDPRGQGIMRFFKGKWINFNTLLYPEIKSNHYFKLTSIGNKIYASNFGSGLLEITTNGDSFLLKKFDQTNSPLTGVIQDNNYIIVQQTQYETKDSLLWMINYSNGNPGYLLIAKDNNDNFYSYLFSTERNYHHLAIDYHGTKWIASSDGRGLLYFNENGTLADTSDDIFGDLKRLTSLPSNVISTLAIDKFGYLWCGTSQGIFIIINPESILSGNVPIIRKLKVLADQSIFCIYVDPLNNKWIGTPEGVYVISSDGFDIVANFNKNNSPLISNEILSITSNPTTGIFYFGSRYGLVSATSLIVKPLPNYDLFAYPSPFYPKKDKYLVIDGLAPQTDIKILTINGDFIQSLATSSRKALWDGKNSRGEYVTSGIYLISTKSFTNSESAIFKIAVINE
ncbi:MAG: type IX secretion system anionic LPS delivery protein PorZ [Candidatus Kapaibacteriales bacterium]